MSKEKDGSVPLLEIVGDLMRGQRHSRRTIAKLTGKSLPTADRWIEAIASTLPNTRRVKEGITTWIVWDGRRETPTRPATVGSCVAASLASMFEGTQHERNLKDARDYLIRLRGVEYGQLDRKFVFAPRGGEYALPEAGGALDEVIDGLLDCRVLSFRYEHNNGQVADYSVQPLSLVIFDHQFYVLSRKLDQSFYCFRFARMMDVDASSERFEYPSKNQYDPRNVLEPGFGVHISGVREARDVVVEIRGPWAPFARKHRWHRSQSSTNDTGDRVTLKLHVRLCPEVETWVLGFGEHATVLAPEELRETVAKRLKRAVARLEGTDGPTLAKASAARRGPAAASSR